MTYCTNVKVHKKARKFKKIGAKIQEKMARKFKKKWRENSKLWRSPDLSDESRMIDYPKIFQIELVEHPKKSFFTLEKKNFFGEKTVFWSNWQVFLRIREGRIKTKNKRRTFFFLSLFIWSIWLKLFLTASAISKVKLKGSEWKVLSREWFAIAMQYLILLLPVLQTH